MVKDCSISNLSQNSTVLLYNSPLVLNYTDVQIRKLENVISRKKKLSYVKLVMGPMADGIDPARFFTSFIKCD